MQENIVNACSEPCFMRFSKQTIALCNRVSQATKVKSICYENQHSYEGKVAT